jgi:hypothetical protein
MVEYLTASEVDALVGRVFGPPLEAQGLERVAPRTWVGSRRAPIREVFTFRKVKGGALIPSFGFSLDLVPHLGGRTVRWHRTPRSALLDVCHEPVIAAPDDAVSRDYYLELLAAPAAARDGARHLAVVTVPQALELYRSIRSIADLPPLIRREIRLREDQALYIQHYLALPFVLAFIGRKAHARQALKRYFEQFPEDRWAAARIADLLERTGPSA